MEKGPLVGVAIVGGLALAAAAGIYYATKSSASTPVQAWTSIPMSSQLKPGVLYRVSDVLDAQAAANPPTVQQIKDALSASGTQVGGVWFANPPPNWPSEPSLPAGSIRVYLEFLTAKMTALPTTDFSSMARLYAFV